ncbi:MAG: hypothetical protein JNK87_11120 [Bryobacterales bacterium]|nr:hypothetical protein [Bryobacterales bacterium]
MSSFQLKFEFEDAGGVQGPELASTWARLEILLDGIAVTELEDIRTKAVRSAVYAPLYPIAEWFAMNWWRIWFEDRAAWTAAGTRTHSLRKAEEGFALPDLALLPSGRSMQLLSTPYTHQHAAVRFLQVTSAFVGKRAAMDQVGALVEGVLARVSDSTPLSQEWQRIAISLASPDDREFCRAAGRLGLDPYAIDIDIGREIDRSLHDLPRSMRTDFFDSTPPATLRQEREPVVDFLSKAANEQIPLKQSLPQAELLSGMTPWTAGYRHARQVRETLQIADRIFSSPEDLLEHFGFAKPVVETLWPTEHLDAVTAVSRNATPAFAVRGNLPASRNFALCRALGEFLFEPEPRLLTRQGESYRQKRSRAFAAEFLAPAAQLQHLIPPGATITQDDCVEIASQFNVSPWVIEKQITNHQLATLVSPSF